MGSDDSVTHWIEDFRRGDQFAARHSGRDTSNDSYTWRARGCPPGFAGPPMKKM